MSFPIRARLTIWYVALLAVILAALGGFLVFRLRADLVHGIDQSLDVRAAQISLGLQNGCEGEFQDVSDASLAGLPQGESAAQLLSPAGEVLESSGDAMAQRSLISPATLAGALQGRRARATVASGIDGEPFRILSVRLPKGSCNGVIVVATSLDDVNRSVHRLLVLLLVAGPAALVAAGAGGWMLARKALSPVARMTREASELGVGRLDERIDVPTSSDELHHLATTLNSMLDRLQRGVEEKRRFVADASHDLRTPLAVMRSELDVSLRAPGLTADSKEVLTSTLDEVERMSRIVESLLTLARIDEGSLELLREPVELRGLAEAVVRSMSSLASERGVSVEVDGVGETVRADRTRLEQVLTNLMSNALRYSETGADVRVSLWCEGSEAGMTVRDSGPGVSPEVLPRIFERFVRADASRTGEDGGSGLGLAICREIVEAHGGRIWVDSAPGRGSAFSFALPIT